MSYRKMPERLYDDPDELAQWAARALAAAQRKALLKSGARKGKGKIRSETLKRMCSARRVQATAAACAASISGSASQITRLRPLRLAA
jgi:DNA transformation protein